MLFSRAFCCHSFGLYLFCSVLETDSIYPKMEHICFGLPEIGTIRNMCLFSLKIHPPLSIQAVKFYCCGFYGTPVLARQCCVLWEPGTQGAVLDQGGHFSSWFQNPACHTQQLVEVCGCKNLALQYYSFHFKEQQVTWATASLVSNT